MTNIPFIQDVREKAKQKNLLVAFPDAEDLRTLTASIFLKDNKIARPVLVGNPDKIHEIAKNNSLNLDGINLINPLASDKLNGYANILFEKRKKKGMTESQAMETVKNPLYFAGFMLKDNDVNVVVGGNVSSTGDVIRAALFTVGVQPGISIISSFFNMILKDGRMLCFADCAVNPNPDAPQLADIAITSAKNFQRITGETPRIAMLSFSTNGSASHELVDKVHEAAQIVKDKAPEIASDGEMQLDAALVPEIGQRKFPGSKVAGNANVLVFPDLNAGNIGYKLTQRLAGAEAVGPIVQGLSKPFCDLSRGCNADDMVNVASICSLMA